MRRAGLLLAGLLLAGCGSPDAALEDDDASTSGAGQPDRPLLPPEAVTLQEVFRLEPDARIVRPGDVAVDDGGFVYVLDLVTPTRILKYDSAGRFALRFGALETEPRLVHANEFALSPWRTVFLIDDARSALTTFLTIGTYSSSVSIEPGMGLTVLPMPEVGEFYLHTWVPGDRVSAVVHMRAPYDSLNTTYSVRLPADLSLREEARGVHYHTAVDPRGNLYVGFWDDYPVRVLTPAGETVRLIDLDRDPVAKSGEQKAAEEERSRAALEQSSPGLDEALVDEAVRPDSLYPLIEELAVDPLGRLWVRTIRPETAGRRVTPYDVFNEAGGYLMQIELPVDVVRTTFAPDGTLYVAAVVDSAGRHEIRGYRVEVRGEPASDPVSR